MKEFIKLRVLLPAFIVVLGLALTERASAQTFTNLYSLYGTNDGATPGALILSGNMFYGTTTAGGSAGVGTVFKVETNGQNYATLYTFTNRSDGNRPGGLVLLGNTLYGVTSGHTVWSPNGSLFSIGTDGSSFTNFYTFNNNGDGIYPTALIVVSNILYGTTYSSFFLVNTDGSGFLPLHNFGVQNNDGSDASGALLLVSNTLYGTTIYGGPGNDGTIYAINTDGTGYTNFFQFAGINDLNPVNGSGAFPRGGLVLVGSTLYGTAGGGGSLTYGTLFAINTDGTGFTNLFNFGGSFGAYPSYEASGIYPNGGLVLSNDVLYGTCEEGGDYSDGAIFSFTTNGATYLNLHSFSLTAGANSTNADGGLPTAGITLAGNTIYGTAGDGGTNGSGTLFELSLTPVPLSVATTSPLYAGAGLIFNLFLAANGGQLPYTWAIISGALPPNMTPLEGNYTYGYPSTIGTYNFTVQVTDAYGVMATQALTLVVTNPDTLVVSFTNATPGMVVTNVYPPFELQGTAVEVGPPSSEYVYDVYYSVNNSAWFSAGSPVNGSWSAYLSELVPGNNTISVYATDSFGSTSATNTITLNYQIPPSSLLTGAPGTPISTNWNPGSNPVQINEGGGIGIVPLEMFISPNEFSFTALAGDVVFLLNPNGGNNPANWAAVVRFFNPSDPNGNENLPATESKTFYPANPGPNYFAGFQLFPRAVFVPIAGNVANPYIQGIIAAYDEMGPMNGIFSGQLADFEILAEVQPTGFTATITSPPNGSFAGGTGALTVYGVTTLTNGQAAVTNVYVQLNGGSWTSATQFIGWTNWTASFTVSSGSNTVAAYAVDQNGNVSPTNSVTFTYYVETPTDVGMTVTAAPEPVAVGSNLVYSIIVSNAGPAAASGLVISNQLPANVTFVSATGGSLPSGGVLAMSIGALNVGETNLNQIIVRPTAAGLLTNLFQLSSTEEADPNLANNSATVVSTITSVAAASADVSLSASAAPNPVGVGSNLVYSITISNAGPATATSVVVSNQLPANVLFVSATGGATPSDGLLLINVGSLALGATNLVQVIVQPTATGKLTNLFEVFASQNDLVPANNSVAVISTVTNAAIVGADLGLTASAVPSPVGVGSNLVYSITVSNAGPSTATSVVVSNQVPANVTFVSATGGATPSGGILLVSLGSLAAGATGSAQMTVKPTATGPLTSVFEVSGTQTDPNLVNNSATVITTVTNAATATNVILYTVVDLGLTNEPLSLNNNGQIVGSTYSPQNKNVGLYWASSSTPATVLAAPAGATSVGASHINNAGQIVGEVDAPAPGFALYWTNSTSHELILGTNATAVSINLSGEIVGWTNTIGSGQQRGVYWANSQSAHVSLATLGGPQCAADSINSSGEIAGVAGLADGNGHAAVWASGASLPVDLGTLDSTNSRAYSLNDAGAIVGSAPDPSGVTQPVYWTNSSSLPLKLGTLGGDTNIAYNINNQAEIVGSASLSGGLTHAVYWTNAASLALDLNNVINTNLGWVLLEATCINDLGEIVGLGMTNGQIHAFALFPVNPPTLADVSLSASAASEPVGVGSNLVYSISVSNAGLATATGVIVSNQIPATVTFVSATGGATPSGGVLLLNLGSLAEGVADSVQVVVQPTVAGQLTNAFTVSSDITDPVPSNNVATVVTTVTNAGTAFQIIPGTPLTGSAPWGGNGSFSDMSGFVFGSGPIELQDPGAFTAFTAMPGDLVMLTDPTGGNNSTNWAVVLRFFNPADPTGINGLAATDAQAFFATNFGGSGFAGFQLFPNVYFNPVFSITTNGFTAIVTVDQQFGPAGVIPAGDTLGIVWTAISPYTDVSLTASATPQPVGVGSDLVYTLTVSNAFTEYAPQTVTATGVVISNQIPANCTFVSATGGATPTNGVLLLNLGSLAEGTNTSVQIVVQPTATNQLTNVFQVFANQFDPDLTNNTATVVTTVTNSPSVSQPIPGTPLTVSGSVPAQTFINSYDHIFGTGPIDGGVGGDFTTLTATPGDLILLIDPTGGNNPTNWAVVVRFFNPGDLTGSDGLTATESQAFFATNFGGSGFIGFQLFPNTDFIPAAGIATTNGVTTSIAEYTEFGPAGVFPAGETDINVFTVISPFTDVSLTASAAPQPVGVGGNLVYSLTVSNAFTQYAPQTVTATGVEISNQIPANCTFVSATGGATPTNGVLLLNLGSLAEGTNTSVQIVVQPNSAGTISNVFQVFANETDPDLTNNSATVVSTVTNAVAATNTVLYEVIDLGTLGSSNSIAYAINNSDQIAGKSEPSGGAYHAAFWTNILIAPVNLGSAILSLASDASAINQPGNVAGVISGSDFTFHAAFWTNSSSPPMDLGTLAGGNASAAYAVNDSGEIVGYSAINDSGSEQVACFWTNSASPGINLGALGGTDGAANSINSSGAIVGSANTSGGASHAAYWTNYTSPPIDLGTLGTGPNSEANCINNIGAIAGDSDVSGSTSTGHAAYWASYSGSPQDLGLLPNGVSSIATSLNNLGEMVGMCDFSNNPARPLVAVVWNSPGGVAEDLNTLIPTNSNWYLAEANGINDLGVIVGAGVVTNPVVGPQLHAFALIPITNADLSITATAAPALVVTVVPADYQTVTNFITVSNTGPATATGVVVSNQIPAGITFDSATGGAVPSGNILLINVGALAAGASISLQVLETPTNAILYTNVFTVSGNQPDPVPANNSATDTFSGEGLPATSFTTSTLSVTDNIPSTASAQATNFTTVLVAKMPNGTVVYSNAFTTTFSNPSVQAAVMLAAEDLTNSGASGYTGPTETGAGQGLQGVSSVSVTNLIGTNFTTVVTEYVGPTNIFVGPNRSEELTLTPGQDDLDTLITFFETNDVVTTDTSVYTNSAVYMMTGIVPQASADLTITANGLPNLVGVGSNLTYSITVSNATPNLQPADSHFEVAPATDVTISNRIPAGVTFVSATGGATPAGGQLLINLGSLYTGSSASVQVVVKPTVAGQLTNWFAVLADQSNSIPASGLVMTVNTVTNETPPTVDLALSMMAVPAPVEAGTPLTYSLTVTNNGAATATGVVVSNTLPVNVTLNSVLPSVGSYTTSGRQVTVSLGSLANGAADSIAIVVIPNAAGQLTNVATVYSAQTDSALTNNSATNITTAVAVPITNLVLTVVSGISLNPQTGLFEEQIKVTNGGPTTPASVLVLISGLGANITLYNATGITNGTPYVQSPGPLGVGSDIVFLLEYYSSTRTTPHPTLTAVAGPAVNPPVITGTVMSISRTVGLSNGDVLVEFAAIPGRIYAVQYSGDLANWQTALPVITAPANRVQWIDAGPPETASSPATAPARYYRVVLLP